MQSFPKAMVQHASSLSRLSTAIQQSSKSQLINLIEELEIKADHYSRSDWNEYEPIKVILDRSNLALLDIMMYENETFLQNIIAAE